MSSYLSGEAAQTKGKSWTMVRYAVMARKMFPETPGLEEWKSWPPKDIESKLKAVPPRNYEKVEELCKIDNVLEPDGDGSYEPMN